MQEWVHTPMTLVYLVTVPEVVLTVSMSLIGTESVPPHRLRFIPLHADALLAATQSQCNPGIEVCDMRQRGPQCDIHISGGSYTW